MGVDRIVGNNRDRVRVAGWRIKGSAGAQREGKGGRKEPEGQGSARHWVERRTPELGGRRRGAMGARERTCEGQEVDRI